MVFYQFVLGEGWEGSWDMFKWLYRYYDHLKLKYLMYLAKRKLLDIQSGVPDMLREKRERSNQELIWAIDPRKDNVVIALHMLAGNITQCPWHIS